MNLYRMGREGDPDSEGTCLPFPAAEGSVKPVITHKLGLHHHHIAGKMLMFKINNVVVGLSPKIITNHCWSSIAVMTLQLFVGKSMDQLHTPDVGDSWAAAWPSFVKRILGPNSFAGQPTASNARDEPHATG